MMFRSLIFKARAKQSSEAAAPNTGRGSGGSSVFVCNINFNDSDPRIRPPICCAIVGLAITGLGIAALLFRQHSVLLTAGVVITTLGGGTLLISFVCLFITRQKMARTLQEAGNAECLEYKDSATLQPYKLDPIMARALVTFYYRSCEDTRPHLSEQFIQGTQIVQVVPTESLTPVESNCFKLIGQPDKKNLDKTQANNKHTDIVSDLEKRIANTSKGRTLPARPKFEKTSRLHVKSVTLDHRTRTPVASSTELSALSPGSPVVQPALSDLITRSKFPSHPRSNYAERLYEERQPMLNPHSNVYQTDLKALRTLK